jgi:outer membrane protein OmpA-like peptidoglycan-associated protein
MSVQEGQNLLLLLGGGLEGIVHPWIVLGLELNSRTYLQNINVLTDPLWLTAAVQARTPWYFNAVFGADISLGKDRREGGERALEPFKIFGGLIFTLDVLAGKRDAERAQRRREARDKAEMERAARQAQAKADSLARKARLDSIGLAQERKRERMRADSLTEKTRQDSAALAEMNKKLEEERAKRSDMEKQLLSTGLLLLDAVYFETGKAEISKNSEPYLKIIAKMLVKYPKLKIEVAGHTDNTGTFGVNMRLSQQRADAVRFYLAEVTPELADRVTARGYGPSVPKSDNRSAEGRSINRRVELQVLNKHALKEYK